METFPLCFSLLLQPISIVPENPAVEVDFTVSDSELMVSNPYYDPCYVMSSLSLCVCVFLFSPSY